MTFSLKSYGRYGDWHGFRLTRDEHQNDRQSIMKKLLRDLNSIALWITPIILFAMSVSFARASTDCYFRLSAKEYDVSLLTTEMAYLADVVAGFKGAERHYAEDSIHFVIPRMRNPKSLIQDLTYALKAIDETSSTDVRNQLKYQLIHVFSNIQNWRLRVANGVDGNPSALTEHLLSNYENYEELLKHLVGRYHAAYFFDPCPTGTPYNYFAHVHTLKLAETPKASISVRDVFDGIEILALEGSKLYRRNSYYLGENTLPAIRVILPSCENDNHQPIVRDFEYNREVEKWTKADFEMRFGLNKYEWFGGGFGDRGNRAETMWRVTTDKLHEAYQKNQAEIFLGLMLNQGVSVDLPDIAKMECY